MRVLIFILLIILSQLTLGQKITYNIPDGYEKDINKQDYKNLVDIAVPIVAKRYAIEYVKDGTIQLKSGQELQALNLHNLIDKCTAVKDKSTLNAIIREHFESLFGSIDEQKKIDIQNYETVKKYLSLRIYPSQTVDERGGAQQIVARNDLEGTYTVLMLDLPEAFTSVRRSVFVGWKKDTAEIFKIAQENIDKQQVQKLTQQFDIDAVKVEVNLIAHENYAASYALNLINNSPEFVGEWGSVVAIPNKGLVSICKISTDKPLDFVKFIQRTKLFNDKSFSEHAQPVSNEFFWYYKGKFTKITVLTDAKGNINVISPFGLTELMTERKRSAN